jgi:hypothetical protein
MYNTAVSETDISEVNGTYLHGCQLYWQHFCFVFFCLFVFFLRWCTLKIHVSGNHLAFVRKETEPGGFLAARFMAEP